MTAADANRDFSKLLRRVREGRSFVITSHGTPVARIVPLDGLDRVRAAGRDLLFARLNAQPATSVGPWTRDELYDE